VLPWPPGARAWCKAVGTGTGTSARACRASHVDPARIRAYLNIVRELDIGDYIDRKLKCPIKSVAAPLHREVTVLMRLLRR